MALKGRTKVMLFDARTGKMTDCVESENMVTNFFDVIFNNTLQRVIKAGRSADYRYLFSISDLAKDLFGGVMIFSERLDSSPDHVYPTLGEAKKMIGNGNQESSIVGSTFKGAINSSESVMTDSYVTFVWDFSTEQCNGDIACICLTSNRGGHLGCRFNAKDSHNGCMSHFVNPFTANLFQPLTSAPSKFTASAQAGALYSFTGGSTGNTMIVENDAGFYMRNFNSVIYALKPQGFSDTDLVLRDALSTRVLTCTTETVDAWGNSGEYDAIVSLDDNTGYARKVETSPDHKLVLLKFTGDCKVVPSAIDVPLTNITLSAKEFCGFSQNVLAKSVFTLIFEDKVFLMFGSFNRPNDKYVNTIRCYILKMDGSFVYSDSTFSDEVVSMMYGTSSISGLSNSIDISTFGTFVVVDDELFMVGKRENYGYVMLHIDKETGEIDTLPRFNSVTNNSEIKYYEGDGASLPMLSSKLENGHLSGCISRGLVMMTDYLATINNMSAVLTKDPTKTMKISYTLEQT